ncbi:MAG: polyprenyl synthetase family protein [Alphaproteobacteria bacterium]|nr:polyprenyl synthetase family protein [Alphaproteobacteria bacterium]
MALGFGSGIVGKNALDLLVDDHKAALGSVEGLLQGTLSAVPLPLIESVSKHLVFSGGKRLRPLLTLSCAGLCGGDPLRDDICHLAVSVELIHSATLLHDDVVDQSVERRGVASASAVYGNAAAVLVGDFLLASAFRLLAGLDSAFVMRLFADTSARLAEGELRQLIRRGGADSSLEGYWQVVESKTASLFATACQAGVGTLDTPDGVVDQLARFGHHLGRGYQVLDDVLDYGYSSSLAGRYGAGVLGKRVGDDFREGKVTAPVVASLQSPSLSVADGTTLRGYFLNGAGAGDRAAGAGDRVAGAGDRIAGAGDAASAGRDSGVADSASPSFAEVFTILERSGGFRTSMGWATAEFDAAREALSYFDDGIIRQRLAALLDFILSRC